jgi:hypothetical protein
MPEILGKESRERSFPLDHLGTTFPQLRGLV